MRRVMLLLFVSCASLSDQCLDHLGEDESSLHGFTPGKQSSGVVIEYVGPAGYGCCRDPRTPCGLDCTGVTVGQLGNSWGDVAFCTVAVKDGKVVGAWVAED